SGFDAARCCSSNSPAGLNTNSENARCRMPLPACASALLAWPISRSASSTRISRSESNETTRLSSCSTNAALHRLVAGLLQRTHDAAGIVRTQRNHCTAATATGELGAHRAIGPSDLDHFFQFPARHQQRIQLALADVHQFAELLQVPGFQRLDALHRQRVDFVEDAFVEFPVALPRFAHAADGARGQAFN